MGKANKSKSNKSPITNSSQMSYKDRREKIVNLIKKLGWWNIDKSQLSRQFGVSRHTIYRDLEAIKKMIGTPNIEQVKTDLFTALKGVGAKAQEILSDPSSTKKEKLEAGRTIIMLSDKFTRFLEDYRYKEKVASEVHITQDIRELFLEWRKLSLSVESGLNSTRINTNKTFLQEQAKAKE